MNLMLLVLTSTISLRGGGYLRDDGGYLEHAQTFGWDRIDASGGAVVEAGTEIVPRLSVHLSWGSFTSRATKRLDTLELRSDAVLAHVRWAAWRWERREVMAQAQISLGGGFYRLSETLDEMQRASSSPGLRAGADVSIYWRWIGFIFGYGYHYASASVSDQIGGSVAAGGHEVSAGLSVRF
jgi:hypothetical protein